MPKRVVHLYLDGAVLGSTWWGPFGNTVLQQLGGGFETYKTNGDVLDTGGIAQNPTGAVKVNGIDRTPIQWPAASGLYFNARLRWLAQKAQAGDVAAFPDLGDLDFSITDRSHFLRRRGHVSWLPLYGAHSSGGWGRLLDNPPPSIASGSVGLSVDGSNAAALAPVQGLTMARRAGALLSANNAIDSANKTMMAGFSGLYSGSMGNYAAALERTVDFDAFQSSLAPTVTAELDARGLPSSGLAADLVRCALAMIDDPSVVIGWASLSAFDVHDDAATRNDKLFGTVDAALEAFHDVIAAGGIANDVIVLVSTEFGRQLKRNSSAGTDHGSAHQEFVIGPAVNGGMFGTWPSVGTGIENDPALDDRALVAGRDFRSVRGAILEWLGVPDRTVYFDNVDHGTVPGLFA